MQMALGVMKVAGACLYRRFLKFRYTFWYNNYAAKKEGERTISIYAPKRSVSERRDDKDVDGSICLR